MQRWLAVILVLAATAGCRRTATAPGGSTGSPDQVGVVDLNQLAQSLGWHDEMIKKITDLGDSFSAQIKQTSDQYDATIQKVKAGFATKPDAKLTAAQQQTLTTMFSAAQRIVVQMHADAEKELGEYREQCMTQYRLAIEPIVRDVAKSHGITVVLAPTDMVLFHDSAADLTAAVSQAAKAHPPTVLPVPLPTLPAAPPLANPDADESPPSTSP